MKNTEVLPVVGGSMNRDIVKTLWNSVGIVACHKEQDLFEDKALSYGEDVWSVDRIQRNRYG